MKKIPYSEIRHIAMQTLRYTASTSQFSPLSMDFHNSNSKKIIIDIEKIDFFTDFTFNLIREINGIDKIDFSS